MMSIDGASQTRNRELTDVGSGPPPAGPSSLTKPSAGDRYRDFIESSPPCNPLGKWDLDACPFETVRSAVLFGKEAGDAQDVAPSDIKQGQMGDCYLLASLAGLASTAAGQAFIKKSIQENKDASGKTVSYTVTLYAKDSPTNRTAASGTAAPPRSISAPPQNPFHAVQVTVDAKFPRAHAVDGRVNGRDEIWPAVYEKAYAALHGGYDSMTKGGRPADALEAITGQSVTHYDEDDPFAPTCAKNDIDDKKLVVLASRPNLDSSDPSNLGLIPHHAYTAKSTGVVDGRTVVYLSNPWGYAQPKPIPLDQWNKWFVGVDSVPVPGMKTD